MRPRPMASSWSCRTATTPSSASAGLTLSGGQRQRVALARAIITDPRVLILDDATSSVDSQTEEEIHATLRRLMAGRTTLLVAPPAVDAAAGRSHRGRRSRARGDSGTHEELMARSPLYRTLLAGPGDDIEADDTTYTEATTADAWAPVDGDAPVAKATVAGPARFGPAPADRPQAG